MQLSQEESVWIHGKYKREVRELFGDVDVHWDYRNRKRITFSANKVLPNFYRTPHAGNESVEKNPLYVLVPDQTVRNVWIGRTGEELRYGTAERHKDHSVLTLAVGIFKGQALLYICLNPLDEAGVESLEVGSLGM